MIPSRQFSLRALLLAVSAVAVVSLWVGRAERQRQAVAALRDLSEYEVVYYSFDFGGPCASVRGRRFEPGAIAEMMGIDFFYSATCFHIDAECLDAAVPHLRRLPYLSEVYVSADRGLDNDEATARINAAIDRLRPELPRARVEEHHGCPILVTKIPIVG